MLSFRIGRIPVVVHPSHFLLAGLIAFMQVGMGTGQPLGLGELVLALPGEPGYGRLVAFATVAWVAIVFVSVLVHELGHALASVAFGYRPEIQLAGLGGNTQPNAPGPIPWLKRIGLTLAGPFAGAALGVVCLFAARSVQGALFAEYVLLCAFAANVFWAALNLMPVVPLDGSHVLDALFTRLFGKAGFVASQAVGLLVGAGLAVVFYRMGNFIGAFIFGMGAFTAFRLIAAYLRGDAPARAPQGPYAEALAKAARLLQQEQLDEAAAEAERILEGDADRSTVARAHHLLGWIELKRGNGRAALDHFAQVDRLHVEEEALAAAFSLIGDDARALGFWELAYRERPSPTVLHEWAATLLRLGRTEQAARLPGVDLAIAHRMAARTAFLRRDFLASARYAERSVELRPSQQAAYDAACAYAQAGSPAAALGMLERASSLGFKDGGYASTDEDLAPLRGDPGFARWLASLGESVPA
jgi:Zn-dependent protease